MKKVTFQVLEGVDKGRIFRDLTIPVTIGREEGNALRSTTNASAGSMPRCSRRMMISS